ncbi:hypothetical protein BsWGS_14198 [Bradybaena similaris]
MMFVNVDPTSSAVHERLPVVPDVVEEMEEDLADDTGQTARQPLLKPEMSLPQSSVHREPPSGNDVWKISNSVENEHNANSSTYCQDDRSFNQDTGTIQKNIHKNNTQGSTPSLESSNNSLFIEEQDTTQIRGPNSFQVFNETEEKTQTSPSGYLTNPNTSATSKESHHSGISRNASVNSEVSSACSIEEDSLSSSAPDFRILKSAMKRSCEEAKAGKRKLSLFNTVMRRVSIHRRESTPTGRIATFLFGVEDPSGDMKDHDGGHTDVKRTAQSKDADGHGDHKVTPEQKKAMQAAKLREGLFLMLSGLYGIIVVILGAVLPITEIFMGDVLDRTFQAFYIYLYVVSIVFLVYVYAYLLRRNQLKTEFLTRTLSRSLSWTRAWGKSWAKGDTDSKSKRKKMISLDSNHHTGTFYLRLGVLGFGIGSMIHSGLNFGAYVSVSSSCTEPIQAIKPVIHLIFTFFQLYFIFMNSKMCIHRYKKLARFGLMHMCATNICVWFHSIVVETMHVIHMQDHGGHHGPGGEGHHSPGASDHHSSPDQHGDHDDHMDHGDNPVYSLINTTVGSGRKLHAAAPMAYHGNNSLDDSCQWADMMGKAVEASGTYLYPCTIEYSLMCAGILYVMWTNVGTKPKAPRSSEHDLEDDDDDNLHRMSVDCTSSSRGLFLGILLTVGTIISIIAFYMLNNKEEMKSSGIVLAHLSETVIYSLTLIALFLAAFKMKGLTFHADHEVDLEDILVLISFTGLLAFIIFSLVASMLSKPTMTSGLTILSNLLMLFQSTTQTLFMLAGDRMTASNEMQARKKPGREFITFLLISNFAMWALNTFETQTPQHNPVQVEFYGAEAWAIFTHISVPLGIYYRFHSTVCFSNIWKNAWKRKSH